MVFLAFITGLFCGAGFSYLFARRGFQNKLKQQIEVSVVDLKNENEAKKKELMNVKQQLADMSYKSAEIEKDYRSLKQQLERSK